MTGGKSTVIQWRAKDRFCSYEHGFARLKWTHRMTGSKLTVPERDMNFTFVLRNIRPAGVQADGQDIGFRMDHKGLISIWAIGCRTMISIWS